MGLTEQGGFEGNYFNKHQWGKKVCISFLISIRAVRVISKYNNHITLCLLLPTPVFYSRILINSGRTVALPSMLECLSLLSISPTAPLSQICCFVCWKLPVSVLQWRTILVSWRTRRILKALVESQADKIMHEYSIHNFFLKLTVSSGICRYAWVRGGLRYSLKTEEVQLKAEFLLDV